MTHKEEFDEVLAALRQRGREYNEKKRKAHFQSHRTNKKTRRTKYLAKEEIARRCGLKAKGYSLARIALICNVSRSAIQHTLYTYYDESTKAPKISDN